MNKSPVERRVLPSSSNTKTRLALLIALGVGAASVVKYCSSDKSHPVPQTRTTTTGVSRAEQEQRTPEHLSENAALLARKIAAIERSMPQLYSRVRANIQTMPQGAVAHLPEDLFLLPFALAQSNSRNTDRNLVALRDHDSGPIVIDDLSYYMYDLMPETQGRAHALASYDPIGNVMRIPADLDMDVTIEQLAMYHELVHKAQTVRLIREQGFTSGEDYIAYQQRINGALRSMGIDPLMISQIDKEVEAYAMELEVANILLQNRLKTGHGSVPQEELDRVLGLHSTATRTDIPSVRFSDMARAYFGHFNDNDPSQISPDFAALICRLHADMGLTPITVRDGQVILLDRTMRVVDSRPL